MIIQYQTTEADLIEYNAALARRRQKRVKKKSSAMFFVFAIGGGMAALSFMPAWGESAPQRFVNFVVPLEAFFLVAFMNGSVSQWRARYFGKVIGRLVMALIPTVLIGLYLFYMTYLAIVISTQGGVTIVHPWSWRLLLPHMFWLYLMLITCVQTVIGTTRSQGRQLRERAEKSRPATVEIVASGVTVSTLLTRSEIQWEGFVDWEETANLFLLYMRSGAAISLPKRAFASDEERNAMRAMARAVGKAGRAGFPVELSATPVAG